MIDIGTCDYDKIAENYDAVRGIDDEYVKYWTSKLEFFGKITDTSTVIDIGCGTGRYSGTISTTGNRKVMGIDPSRQMLTKALVNDEYSRISWLQCRVESLPFRKDIFDVGILALVVHHIPGEARPNSYKEIYDVLRPGGRLVIWTRTPDQIRSSLIALFPGVAEIDCKRMPPIMEITSDLTGAGFGEIEFHKVMNYTDYRLRSRFIGRVKARYISTLSMFSEKEFEEGLEILKNRLDERFGSDEKLYDPMEFTIAVGKK